MCVNASVPVFFLSQFSDFPIPCSRKSAQVTGLVSDSSKAAISGAAIEIVNEDTREIIQTRTNHSGLYTAPSVKPGHYTATVSAPGFEKEIVEHLVVEVAAKLSFDYVLHAGAVSQTVSVDGSGVSLNTTDATVSTVIDRQFVSNMPLNGRSFQSLLTLVPGVTVVPSPFGQGESGEIAVNGQRTEANNFLIDGVNANTGQANGYGGSPVWGAGFSGATPAETALGTTQSLVSIDALQSFGRQPQLTPPNMDAPQAASSPSTHALAPTSGMAPRSITCAMAQ